MSAFKKHIIVASFFLTASIAFSEEFYVVKEGDALSIIAENTFCRPDCGKVHSLIRLLALNPHIRNPHFILPGNEIRIGESAPETVTPVPLAITKQEEKTDPVTRSATVSAGVNYFMISGIDAVTSDSARILSGASPRVNFGYSQSWDKITSISILGMLESYSLTPFSNSASYESDSGIRTSFGVQVKRRFFSDLDLSFEINAAEKFFLRAKTATVLAVDKVMILEPKLTVKYPVFIKKNAEIGVMGGYGLLLSSQTNTYTIQSGSTLEVGAYFRYETRPEGSQGFGGLLIYKTEAQDSSIFLKSFSELYYGLTYFWRLDFAVGK